MQQQPRGRVSDLRDYFLHSIQTAQKNKKIK